MIHFEGTFRCRDANALAFIPFRRRVIRDGDWRIAGEDADAERTQDAAPSLSASPEQDAQRARLRAINKRNAEFWEAQQSWPIQ